MKYKWIIVSCLVSSFLLADNLYNCQIALAQKIYCSFKQTNYSFFKNSITSSKIAIAIALNESDLGINVENNREKSYGIFQNNLNTLKNRYISTKYLKECLKKSYVFNFINFIMEIEFWKRYLKNNGKFNLENLLRHYNGGFDYSKRMTDLYISKFYKKIAWVNKNWNIIKKANCSYYRNEINFLNEYLKKRYFTFKVENNYCILNIK